MWELERAHQTFVPALVVRALSGKNRPSRFLCCLPYLDIGVIFKDFTQHVERFRVAELFQFLNRLQPDFGIFIFQTPNMVCQ